MMNKRIAPPQDPLPMAWTSQASAPLDLFDLIGYLWQRKMLLISITLCCTIAALGYALTAKEQWSSSAQISTAEAPQIAQLQVLLSQLSTQGINSDITPDELLSTFVREFESGQNKLSFLTQSAYIKQLLTDDGINSAREQSLFINNYREKFIMLTRKSKSDETEYPSFGLSISARSAEAALSLLTDYTNFINNTVRDEIKAKLLLARNRTLEGMKKELEMTSLTAQSNLDSTIQRTDYAAKIAMAASKNSTANMSQVDDKDFPIALGAEGLKRKLELLKSIKDPAQLEPKITLLKQRISQLESIQITALEFTPFSYLKAPELPLQKEAPKRALIVLMSTLAGFLFSLLTLFSLYAFEQQRRTNQQAA